jgi:hypothetical protein
MGGSTMALRARWAAVSRMTGLVDGLPVLIWSEAVLLARSFWTFGPLPSWNERRRSSSSGGSWMVASVIVSTASSTLPRVEVIVESNANLWKNVA